jgi:hypothetical protein
VNQEGMVPLKELIKKAHEQIKEEQREQFKDSLEFNQTALTHEQDQDPIAKFYNQANESLEKLISIR